MRVTANVLLRNPKTGQVQVVNAGDEVPQWAEKLVGGHLLPEGEEPVTDSDSVYSGWKVTDIKSEIAVRNEARETAGREQLPVKGKKAALVAALEQDDGEDYDRGVEDLDGEPDEEEPSDMEGDLDEQ